MAVRVTQASAEALVSDNTDRRVRATQLSAEALLTGNTATRIRATQLSAEVLQTVGTNPAVLRVTQLSAEVLIAVPATSSNQPPYPPVLPGRLPRRRPLNH